MKRTANQSSSSSSSSSSSAASVWHSAMPSVPAWFPSSFWCDWSGVTGDTKQATSRGSFPEEGPGGHERRWMAWRPCCKVMNLLQWISCLTWTPFAWPNMLDRVFWKRTSAQEAFLQSSGWHPWWIYKGFMKEFRHKRNRTPEQIWKRPLFIRETCRPFCSPALRMSNVTSKRLSSSVKPRALDFPKLQ